MWIQQLVFYAFAAMALTGAVVVVGSKNPVISALFLVVTFFACAGIWLLMHAEFLALILILVYVGAVMTLFLFVIMMLNIDLATAVERVWRRTLPVGLVIVSLMVFLTLVALKHFVPSHLANAAIQPTDFANTLSLGLVLYTDYAYALEVAGVLLLVAMVAAISLAHRAPRGCKTQNPGQQIRVKPSDRLKIVSMPAEKP